MVRPMSDLGLYPRGNGDLAHPREGARVAAANDRFRRDILDRLGDLRAAAVPRHPGHQRRAMAVVGVDQRPQRHADAGVPHDARRDRDRRRRGRQRVWDLAERVYPADTPVVPADEARRHAERAAAGIARHRPREGDRRPGRTVGCGRRGRARDRRGRPRGVARGPRGARKAVRGAHGAAVAVRPPDPRPRPSPRAVRLRLHPGDVQAQGQRRWGYFALPVLHDDRLVGKVDATADRKGSKLRVRAIHEDVPFTRAITAAVDAELEALASWLGLGVYVQVTAAAAQDNASTDRYGKACAPGPPIRSTGLIRCLQAPPPQARRRRPRARPAERQPERKPADWSQPSAPPAYRSHSCGPGSPPFPRAGQANRASPSQATRSAARPSVTSNRAVSVTTRCATSRPNRSASPPGWQLGHHHRDRIPEACRPCRFLAQDSIPVAVSSSPATSWKSGSCVVWAGASAASRRDERTSRWRGRRDRPAASAETSATNASIAAAGA